MPGDPRRIADGHLATVDGFLELGEPCTWTAGMVQPEVTVGRGPSGPLASGKSLGVTGATVCGSKTSVRSSDLPLWQVTVASHTADCYPQPRFIEPSRTAWYSFTVSLIAPAICAICSLARPRWAEFRPTSAVSGGPDRPARPGFLTLALLHARAAAAVAGCASGTVSGNGVLTVRTGHVALRSTCSATLPMSNRRIPVRPCVPIAIRSARTS